MSDAGNTDYAPDHLYERLFQPWTLPESEWPLCKEDWARVDAVTRLPWKGHLLDFGAGDGTLAAMVCSRNPLVRRIHCYEADEERIGRAQSLWDNETEWPLDFDLPPITVGHFDGALCCEVLEHLKKKDARDVLSEIHSAMKPGAMLCVTVPKAGGSREKYPGHIRSFTAMDLMACLRNAGFTKFSGGEANISDIWWMAVCHA
jgi:2-polyprenyl-3-methyl-5-hydroxy-6-metoxy-1,4-benzoquinol methylase